MLCQRSSWIYQPVESISVMMAPCMVAARINR
jgi:hypothetical protein